MNQRQKTPEAPLPVQTGNQHHPAAHSPLTEWASDTQTLKRILDRLQELPV